MNTYNIIFFLTNIPGQKARDADRERIKRLRDVSQPNFVVSNGGSQRDQRGDLASLPQVISPPYEILKGIVNQTYYYYLFYLID